MKIQILATGFNKFYKGFTLLELLVVLLIIGIASSVILINTSSLERISQGTITIERNFQIISEESILSGNIIGWFPSSASQKIYRLNNLGEKGDEYNLESLNQYWDSILDYRKIIKGSDGEEFELDANFLNYPSLIFYPSGENTGAEIFIYKDIYVQKTTIHQNGKISNETEIK